MLSWFVRQLKQRALTLYGQSGFVSSGQGMAPGEDGLITVVIGTVVGAFCGMVGGFILSRILRYVSFLTGRDMGGLSWVIYGLIAGAILCGCLAATDDDD
jgi:hypothetical protein